jgi:hypothetical protein
MVIVTDASCSFDGWHRASSGISDIKPEFSTFIKSRARVPLFTTMVVFEKSLDIDLDALVFNLKNTDPENTDSKNTEIKNIGGLWFAAKNSSKSGFIANNFECWTLVSTPDFAVKEISMTTMQDKAVNALGKFIYTLIYTFMCVLKNVYMCYLYVNICVYIEVYNNYPR